MPELKELIKTQITLLETLKQQLETELHLISTRDPESLTNLVEHKAQTLDAIAQQDEIINAAFRETEDTEDAGVNTLMDTAREHLEQCKYRTEINAKAVEQGQLRLAHLRNLLLEARAKESMTYDKSGQAKGGGSGKSIKA